MCDVSPLLSSVAVLAVRPSRDAAEWGSTACVTSHGSDSDFLSPVNKHISTTSIMYIYGSSLPPPNSGVMRMDWRVNEPRPSLARDGESRKEGWEEPSDLCRLSQDTTQIMLPSLNCTTYILKRPFFLLSLYRRLMFILQSVLTVKHFFRTIEWDWNNFGHQPIERQQIVPNELSIVPAWIVIIFMTMCVVCSVYSYCKLTVTPVIFCTIYFHSSPELQS